MTRLTYRNLTAKLFSQYFLEKFLQIYDQAFPERKTEIKPKSFISPWITRDLRRFSRKKQRL